MGAVEEAVEAEDGGVHETSDRDSSVRPAAEEDAADVAASVAGEADWAVCLLWEVRVYGRPAVSVI